MNFALTRSTLLNTAALVVEDMTTKDVEPGHRQQFSTDHELAERLRTLAKVNHEAVPPWGGKGAALQLMDPHAALLRYLQHLVDADIHHVKVSMGDDGAVRWRERADAMLAEFAPALTVRGARVLSVGTNSGGDMAALLAAGAQHVTGLEVMPELVSFTSALLVLSDVPPTKWRLLQGSIEDYEPEGDFDVVYNVGVLYHIENPMKALRASFAVLRAGGTLALETEVIRPRHGEMGCADVMCWPLREPSYVKRGQNWPTWWIPSEDALTVMLRAVGFVDVHRIPNTRVAKSAFVARKP